MQKHHFNAKEPFVTNVTLVFTVWVAEFGKYDMMKLVSMGPKVLAEFEKYCAQAARIVTDSHKWKNPDVDTIAAIIDFDGLRLTQYAQIPSKPVQLLTNTFLYGTAAVD